MGYCKSELTSGILYEYREKIADTLIHKVEADLHADTYTRRENYDMYAEPEFTGKYLDLCMKLYRTSGDKIILENAKKVVESILHNQRQDGYLGCLPEGKEVLNFGVWNQTFTVLGLLSYYNTMKDERVLNAAEKSVSWVMSYFIEGNLDILDSLNYGTQHISILYPLCRLYRITQKERYKVYIRYIIDRIKNSDLNFLDFENIMELRSKKGIENFVVLLGILEYADIFMDKDAIDSVEKYWQQTYDTQIRNTGNGTIAELWTEEGNGCMFLSEEIKANETCVAVGWIELSMALFHIKQDVKFLDAVDKTLYNHILASVAEDGSDFAYYQGNCGKKIKNTEVGMYKCCRYRGFTLFSYMDEMLFYEDEDLIIPMIYTSCDYRSKDVEIVVRTNYPFGQSIEINLYAKAEKQLKLRIPKNCKVVELTVDGCREEMECSEGYINWRLQPNKAVGIKMLLEFEVTIEIGRINKQPYVAFSYGPILLAAYDEDSNVKIQRDDLHMIKVPKEKNEKIAFVVQGIRYCDYASADNYSVWVPVT